MAYCFTGFFARPAVLRPENLPAAAVWREITSPFIGVGVRLPAPIDDEVNPAPDDVQILAAQLGLLAADCWLYLHYVCWGGDIDFVFGLGARGNVPFGPFEESALDQVEKSYVGLMGRFGVSPADALQFEPFVRGYWEDD